MKLNSFLTGVAAGVVVGSALSITGSNMMGKKGRRVLRHGAGRALHTMGDIIDSIVDTITD